MNDVQQMRRRMGAALLEMVAAYDCLMRDDVERALIFVERSMLKLGDQPVNELGGS